MSLRISACLLSALLVASIGCERGAVDNPRFIRDQNLSVSLAIAISDLAEQNLEGQPLGEVDLDATCLDGGSARIHGSLAKVGTQSSYVLTYELRGCAFSADYVDYRINADVTGDLEVNGTWNQVSGYGSEHMSSPHLRLTGRAVTDGFVDDFDTTCPFSFNLISNQTSDAYFGDWCERPFAASLSHRG